MARQRQKVKKGVVIINNRDDSNINRLFRFCLIVFWLLVITSIGWAQVDTAWVRRWTGPGALPDMITSMAVDRGGNVYAVGYSTGVGTGQDILVLKYSSNGDLRWARRYDWRGLNDVGVGVVVDASGNVYVAGYVTDSLTSSDYLVIKYDSSGNQAWLDRYDGPANSNDIITGIAIDSTGYVYVTGYSYDASNLDDFCTIKYTPTGNRQWVARYGGANIQRAQAIAVDFSGNVYVTGYTYSGNDYLTVKYNANGQFQWADRYNGEGNGSDYAVAVCVDQSGNCYVTGYSVGTGTADYDYVTVKYTPTGNREWADRYNGEGNDNDYAYGIVTDQNGNIFVTGYSAGLANNDIATLKYNNLGQRLWVQRYESGVNEYARTIDIDNVGNVYIGGYLAQGSNYNFLVVSYNPNGNLRLQATYDGQAAGNDFCYALKVDRWRNVFAGGLSYGGSVSGFDGVVIKYIQPDVATFRVVFPAGTVDTATTVIPQAVLANQGSAPTDFKAYFTISRPGGARIYLDSVTVSSLGPGDSVIVSFQEWLKPHPLGTFEAKCSTYRQFDQNLSNNVSRLQFQITAGPYGWRELVSVPSGPSGRQVKDGGALTFCAAENRIYAIKGNRSGDFYYYQPNLNNWVTLPVIPSGPNGKQPGKGARLASDNQGNVYLVRGNNTREFWRYNADSGWVQLQDIPAGVSGKAVKGGSDAVFVEADNSIYLLKGYKNEFYRFRIDAQNWEELAPAPPAGISKWDKGSFIVYDNAGSIYACRAKYNELWRYDIGAGVWDTLRILRGMPFLSKSGRSSKLKDGGCGDYFNGSIYALKGANTCEFWRYDITGDTWVEIDTLPAVGSTQKKKRAKAGADLVYGGDAFYAFKGNKTLEFWRYAIPPGDGLLIRSPGNGTGTRVANAGEVGVFGIGRNSVVIKAPGFKDGPAKVVFYDPAGRVCEIGVCRFNSGLATIKSSRTQPGVYFIRVEQGKWVVKAKVIIDK